MSNMPLLPFEALSSSAEAKTVEPGKLGATMSELEQLLFQTALSALLLTVKNPTHAAALKTDLLNAANSIYEAYGIVPPTPPTA